MATPPVFSAGAVLTAAQMNAVGLWEVTPSSATNGTLNGATVTVNSSVTSVTVNGVFSADYENYRVVYQGVSTSATNALELTFGGSTGSTYNDGGFYLAIGGAAITVESQASRANIRIGIVSASQSISGWFDIYAPNVSGQTWVNGGSMAASYYNWRQGVDTNTAAHTSFKLAAASGTMSGGKIRVYGYRD